MLKSSYLFLFLFIFAFFSPFLLFFYGKMQTLPFFLFSDYSLSWEDAVSLISFSYLCFLPFSPLFSFLCLIVPFLSSSEYYTLPAILYFPFLSFLLTQSLFLHFFFFYNLIFSQCLFFPFHHFTCLFFFQFLLSLLFISSYSLLFLFYSLFFFLSFLSISLAFILFFFFHNTIPFTLFFTSYLVLPFQ
ncbi:unnamed protein product [Acanthosepion pharaonis]|uniref:Uncharacterized protein n=1 Tax=Acanthosepion pharaonis TaxID=158019 RepID=A0A812DW96_ACAPH|nr:unnamed protein product [Sepia pharaonis]